MLFFVTEKICSYKYADTLNRSIFYSCNTQKLEHAAVRSDLCYFLEADDHTILAVSWEGKNVVLVALVMLKINVTAVIWGRRKKRFWVFFICRYGLLLFKSLFIYSVYSVYVCATAVMKIILTLRFDLLNATRVEIYIVIKVK